MKIYTIGVYNSSEDAFFKKLTDNKIDTFIDIRQRRGVRGAKYSFVNSIKLQNKLTDLNIKYIHHLDLAPSTEVRNLQKIADLQNNNLKKDREELNDTFIDAFEKVILKKFDLKSFIDNLETNNSLNIVLFCVEENSNACHRSIVAKKIATEFNLIIYDL
ncbi:hypothetical protein Flavo103_10880 [Flavobacterium collinsii]|uniref:DUF488 domain-containing protein n=1 Tax=Flavobacterium collinsii TaxID=1114861 RepID=UPI0022BF0C06|nr:DUF488 domain-containing protein [Flavobacterium collinsii]GIQ57952.1 hypothetical protein Flavo103_10880 [Flavobacterium collinsii]